jgi:hypothetical protein
MLLAMLSAGRSMLASMPIIPITTSNSININLIERFARWGMPWQVNTSIGVKDFCCIRAVWNKLDELSTGSFSGVNFCVCFVISHPICLSGNATKKAHPNAFS